jgi:hypothetical protein
LTIPERPCGCEFASLALHDLECCNHADPTFVTHDGIELTGEQLLNLLLFGVTTAAEP